MAGQTKRPAVTLPAIDSPTRPTASTPGAATPADTPETLASIDLDYGKVRPQGVGLKDGELAALDIMADELGIKRNSIMRAAIRYVIKAYRDGTLSKDDLFAVETVSRARPK